MFSGLISRWAMPRECSHCTPSRICRKTSRINSSFPTYYAAISEHPGLGRGTTHTLSFSDHGEQVPVLSVVHHDIQMIALLDQSVHGDDARVCRCQAVKRNLSTLEMPLSRVKAVSAEAFDRAIDGLSMCRVDGEVHDAVRAGPDD